VTLSFRVGGGRPPPSHELLLIEAGGDAWYLTGMPWPGQPPFDEIGAYRGALADGGERLRGLARDVVAAEAAPPGPADAGFERLGIDADEVSWNRETRPAPMRRFVDAARAEIAALRRHPHAALHGELVEGPGVLLVNRGTHPLALAGGELRAGRGRADRPPSPLRLLPRPAASIALPAALAPGEPLGLELPDPGPVEEEGFATPYALVHVRWRSPIVDEDEWVDGWLVAGSRRA